LKLPLTMAQTIGALHPFAEGACMVASNAATVAQYLAELPPERRNVMAHVRRLVNTHLPKGYVEAMGFGMICWQIPLTRYPDTYNQQPLAPVALAAQKNHFALYLGCVYGEQGPEAVLRKAYAAAGRKLDMGKSCLRFKRIDELLPEAIAPLLSATTVEGFVAVYEASRALPKSGA
jgi:Domain of unknown function (DU1801)